ncbi:TetR/AcrR family transcriptional regulator [Streptomyces sp. NPDC050149]|uniref:TetR/AcrR family transcriptional regulator n=1 Tax=Streptomyces sp. NPDC050149 TaxID=3365603 RepID=UPI0037A6C080
MESPRSRGTYAKTAARRAQILSAAGTAFAEHGYAASSLRDIAKRAGLTHAGVQHHFPTKAAVLAAMLAERDAIEETRSRDTPHASPAEFLTRLLRDHQETPELTGLWAELAIAARRNDHPAHDYFVGRYEQARDIMTAHLRSRAELGELRAGLDPRVGAALLVSVLDGLQTQWLLNRSLDVVEPLRQFLQLIEKQP